MSSARTTSRHSITVMHTAARSGKAGSNTAWSKPNAISVGRDPLYRTQSCSRCHDGKSTGLSLVKRLHTFRPGMGSADYTAPPQSGLGLRARRSTQGLPDEMWLQAGMADDDLVRIRQHVNQERTLGDERFQRPLNWLISRIDFYIQRLDRRDAKLFLFPTFLR